MGEYVIWGHAPGSDTEVLLVSESAGLRDMGHAKATAAMLETKHGCTATRVQKLTPLGDGVELANMFRTVLTIPRA